MADEDAKLQCSFGYHKWGKEVKDNTWTYFIRYTKRCLRRGCNATETRDERRTK